MLTQFQRTYITQLQQRADVKHLCHDYLADDYEFERPFPVVFIDVNNNVCGIRLGRKRVLGVTANTHK